MHGDQLDHTPGCVGRTADNDGHGVVRVGFADGRSSRDQLGGDGAFAPMELPGGSAGSQLLGGLGAQVLLQLSGVPGRQRDRINRLRTQGGWVKRVVASPAYGCTDDRSDAVRSWRARVSPRINTSSHSAPAHSAPRE